MAALSIVIVSWNTRELLRACLASLQADCPDAEVFVIDNASTDGTPEMIRSEFARTRLDARTDNLGFVKANNLALRQILAERTAEYVWLLNPDTVVHPGAVRALLAFMRAHPKCGLCGPRLQNPDASLQHGAFMLPGLMQLLIDVVPRLQARLRDTRWDGRYAPAQFASDQPFPIGTPLGAAMFARIDAVRAVGLLDEGFVMYSEEIDWAKRMHDAGWQVWCEPRATVTHYGGASSSQASARAERHKWDSRRRYFRKHYSPLKRWLALAIAARAAPAPHGVD
jgi:hypothetical protein